jgi:O-succinylbenzoic acid--CoA ligase
MEPVLSLSDHLAHAAEAWPNGIAIVFEQQRWTFQQLHAETVAQAGSTALHPWMVSGSSLELALAAYISSARRQAFFPVAPENQCSPLAGSPNEAALIISTSGSEGQPRAVLLGNGQLSHAAQNANVCLELHHGDLWLNCLPLYHIGGQSILWRCAQAGACILLHDTFVLERVAHDLSAWPITHISLVPAMLARLLNLNITPPRSLRAALIGGAALSRPLHERAIAAGWPLYVSYGMSETAAMIAAFKPNDGPWHEGMVGRPMPGHDIEIDADGRIRIRGPQVMIGYLDGSGVDGDGWFTTSDLGELDATGKLRVLGRADDMLISGGRNIHPQKIESDRKSVV